MRDYVMTVAPLPAKNEDAAVKLINNYLRENGIPHRQITVMVHPISETDIELTFSHLSATIEQVEGLRNNCPLPFPADQNYITVERM